jgi:hypothetical protein
VWFEIKVEGFVHDAIALEGRSAARGGVTIFSVRIRS